MNRILAILLLFCTFSAKAQITLSYGHINIVPAEYFYSPLTGFLDTNRAVKTNIGTYAYIDSLVAAMGLGKVDSVKKSNDTFYYYKGGVKYFAGLDATGAGGSGITTLNSQTGTTQSFATGTAGTDFGINSSGDVHTFNIPTASATNRGLLSTTDWSTFNGKQAALGYTPENTANKATDLTSNDNTHFPTTAATKTAVDAKVADAINDGTTTVAPSQNAVYDALALKQNSLGFTAVPTTRAINTTSPISGGGDLSADRTIAIANAAADGATKGAASFNASDFDATAGNISIDYANGQAASGSVNGFLSSSSYTNFLAGYNDKINSASYSAGQLTLTQQDAGTVTATINDATTATKGIASYSSTFFSVASGVVSVKSGGIGSTEILDGSVALGDMANMATASILGRNTAGTGAPEVLSAATTKSLLSLNNVDNTSDATKNSATATLTNKRITPRIGTTASSSTPTPDADANDIYTVTALAAGATFGAPTGTPVNGQTLLIRIKDNGTARTLAWNAIYRAGTDFALPTTTVISKTMYVQFIYNSADSKWDCIGSTNGF